MTINGPPQLGLATYQCEIDGAGSNADVLALNEAVTLTDTKLEVTWLNNPTATGTYTIMTFASRVGEFASVTIPAVPGWGFTTGYTATAATITVSNSVLTVRWTRPITAELQGKQTLVSWSVADQTNNDYFAVEHSTDGTNFREIGIQGGEDDFVGEMPYNFTHADPASGSNYYRIKQVDYDGGSSFSNIASVDFQSGKAALYPNPTTAPVSIKVLTATWLSVYDPLGRLVKEIQLAAGTTEISLRDYPNGLYVFRTAGGEAWTVVKE